MIINRIVILTTILLLPALIMSLARYFTTGWVNVYLFHIILYCLILLTAIYRKRIKTSYKIVFITFIYFAIANVGLLTWSLGGAYFYIILAIAILTILTKRKTTLILTAIFLGIYSVIAYGFISGYLSPSFDLNVLSRMSSHWISQFISLFSLCIIFIYGFGDIYKELISTLESEKVLEKKYRTLFERANDAITLLKDGVFFDCNDKACELFMYSKEELIGKSVKELSPEYQIDNQKSEAKALTLVKLTLEGYPQQFEWQHKRANGEVFDVSISLNRIELQDEVYVQGILHDITEKKKTEAELTNYRNHLEKLVNQRTLELEATTKKWKLTSEDLTNKNEIIEKQNTELQLTLKHLKETQAQLLQVEKMASLGTLTAGVAHEINNPLNYLMGSYVGLSNYFEEHGSKEKEKTDVLINSINVGINRISGIVQGLEQFSLNNEGMDEDCDVHSIIDNCLVMLHNKLDYNTEIIKDFSKKQVIIEGNIGKLHQVFFNIISNAIQAIAEDGKIVVKTKTADENIMIEIIDNGIGIDEKYLKQLTDPFFTTKSPGEGTGLGLSISYSIIKEHSGTLEFKSEPKKGTNVIVTLPLKR